MHTAPSAALQALIRPVPDFPKPGVLFQDITPLLADPARLGEALELLRARCAPLGATHVVGAESRGFIFGVPLAQALGLPFLPARKPGKLPRPTRRARYSLEYGEDALELHAADLPAGARVLLVDDLLATGGTAEACARLIEEAGAAVAACVFLIELEGLGGRARLAPRACLSLLSR
ncbi:MAG: adenine phosphoribosyltransferase [Deltaproteobacteria bacterium]|nr:adenine phosphoribosyltransferase [Deltaproteobacteria bacterium]